MSTFIIVALSCFFIGVLYYAFKEINDIKVIH